MKTTEQMAREKLELYIKPMQKEIGGKVFTISPGFPPHIAAQKAASANPNFAAEIYKLAKSY
jgi:hypothetical protein